MSRRIGAVVMASVFAAGLGAGFLAAKGTVSPEVYRGKDPKAAGLALLQLAEEQAGSGSWERIGVGRVYYLSGDKAKGQAIFDSVAKKAERGDWERIAKVYAEAGEWEKAEPIFRRINTGKEDDAGLALAGALFNLHGDRKTAEEVFDRSFKRKSDEVWNTLNAAGSYLGVQPN